MAGRSGVQPSPEDGAEDQPSPLPICSDLGYPPPPLGVPRRDSSFDMSELMPKIQAKTAKSSANVTNNLPTVVPAPQRQYFGVLGQRHVICISGLPNNGKAFLAHELGWYLEFFHGAKVKYFEVERYFNHGSKEANAHALLDDVVHFLHEAGGIGASGLDSDESTHEKESDGVPSEGSPSRRKETFLERKSHDTDAGRVAIVMAPRMSALAALDNQSAKELWSSTWSSTNALDRNWIRRSLKETQHDCKLMFIEIELTDATLLRMHADATGSAERQKLEELREWFECSYTPLGRSASSEAHLSFMRYRNFRDMETHCMHGYLRMRVAQFLSVLRPWKHTIYLSRHGESTYNVEKKLGGDPPLTSAGDEYAKRLGTYAVHCIQTDQRTGNKVAARLWTSSLQRTEQTAAYIPHPEVDVSELQTQTMEMGDVWEQMRHRVFRNLDEIYAGTYDGMTEDEIAAADARFGADRKVDKLATRYPHGESYLDLITRLEPLIHELHAYQEPLLIVSHQATLRVLRAYLLRDRSMPRDLCPAVDIPQHTVMKITWDGWNYEVAPSVLEKRMKAKEWPPSEAEKWSPAAAPIGEKESPIGCEEWFWLGPDPKLSGGNSAAAL
jgi:broad specificity phosphatase PhoE